MLRSDGVGVAKICVAAAHLRERETDSRNHADGAPKLEGRAYARVMRAEARVGFERIVIARLLVAVAERDCTQLPALRQVDVLGDAEVVTGEVYLAGAVSHAIAHRVY